MQNLAGEGEEGGGGVSKVHFGLCESSEYQISHMFRVRGCDMSYLFIHFFTLWIFSTLLCTDLIPVEIDKKEFNGPSFPSPTTHDS